MGKINLFNYKLITTHTEDNIMNNPFEPIQLPMTFIFSFDGTDKKSVTVTTLAEYRRITTVINDLMGDLNGKTQNILTDPRLDHIDKGE